MQQGSKSHSIQEQVPLTSAPFCRSHKKIGTMSGKTGQGDSIPERKCGTSFFGRDSHLRIILPLSDVSKESSSGHQVESADSER